MHITTGICLLLAPTEFWRAAPFIYSLPVWLCQPCSTQLSLWWHHVGRLALRLPLSHRRLWGGFQRHPGDTDSLIHSVPTPLITLPGLQRGPIQITLSCLISISTQLSLTTYIRTGQRHSNRSLVTEKVAEHMNNAHLPFSPIRNPFWCNSLPLCPLVSWRGDSMGPRSKLEHLSIHTLIFLPIKSGGVVEGETASTLPNLSSMLYPLSFKN